MSERVYRVGKIDIDKFKGFYSNIATDEVIITEKQITHIEEERKREYYAEHLTLILSDPDYILESKKCSNTVALHKNINGNRYRLILRLKVPQDPDDYGNSVITVISNMNEKRYERHINNEKVIYKKENV